jgi:hypothetical protein
MYGICKNSLEFDAFHVDVLHNLYSVPRIIRMVKLKLMGGAGNVARMREKSSEYRTLVGKSEGKRPLGRPRRRCVYNIKVHL